MHLRSLAFLPFFWMLFTTPAQAYLDPGSGSYIIQVTIGVIAGGIFMLKNYWSVIKVYAAKFFSKNKKQD